MPGTVDWLERANAGAREIRETGILEPPEADVQELQYRRVRRAARTLYAALVYRDQLDEHPLKCTDCKRANARRRCEHYYAMQRQRAALELAAWQAYLETGLPASWELAAADEEGPIGDE